MYPNPAEVAEVHWLAADAAIAAEVRLYDRLFRVPYPGSRNHKGEISGAASVESPGHTLLVAGEDDEEAEAETRNFLDDLDGDSKRVITARV